MIKRALLLCSLVLSPITAAIDITPQEREQSVKTAAEVLAMAYVYPDVGEKMKQSVLKRFEQGEYDTIVDDAELAQKLTEDFRAISKDKHLRLRARSSPRVKRKIQPISDVNPRTNYGFETAKVLANDIGYLKFNMFAGSWHAKKEATKMLGRLKGAKALIFDVRDNIGGSPQMIEFISSYLFHQPTRLNVFYDRKGNEVGQSMTYMDIPGTRFEKDIPIYVLTSQLTFSAAEEFSYNLQSFDKATIVGETTGGGAHPIEPYKLNGNFTLIVPVRRAFNPITKTNWEGVGVKPDIKAKAIDALDVAIEAANKKLSGKL